jgi:predicted TIM-barrel fold metal-dependent hydrolase
VKDLVKHFGAERLVWGSDFPFVVNECGYEKAPQIVNEIEDLTEEERDLILGGSLEKMFPKSFYSSS